MKRMKAASLILDYTLYPRNNVDATHVRHLVQALEAGSELPPVVIDKKTKRVVDGFHRVKAHLKYGGDDAEIEVIEKNYKDDATLFTDSMRYNAAHGVKLDSCDRTHCLIVAETLGLTMDTVAGVLNIPIERLGELKANTAKSGKLTIPLKRTVRHKSGQNLTKRQVQANDKLSGMNQQFYVNQLIELIESDLLDTSDDKLMAQLATLAALLDGLNLRHAA